MIETYVVGYSFTFITFAILLSRGNFTQLRLSSVFLLAHAVLFLVTPLLFQQSHFFENKQFFISSFLSLLAIFAGFIVPIIKSKYSYTPRLFFVKIAFYFFIILTLYNLSIGFNSIGDDKVMSALSSELQGRGLFSIFTIFITILSMIYIAYLQANNKSMFIIFYFVFLSSIILTSAHRTPVIIALISPFLVWVIWKRKGYLPIYVVLSSFALIPLIMYVFNFFRQGLLLELSNASLSFKDAALNSLSGLNTSKYFYDLINSDLSIEMFSKAYYWFITYIPRRLWEDKPIVGFNYRVTEELHGYKIGEFKGADVLTYTVPGEGYLQFHYVGVFLLTFFAVYMTRLLLNFYLSVKYSEYLIVTLIFGVFINFRAAFDSFLHSVVQQFIFLIILLPFFFRRKREYGCNKMKYLRD